MRLIDTSTDTDGTVVSWRWDFGDGTESTEKNPSHDFAAAGDKSVKLVVTDNLGATDGRIRIVPTTAPVTTSLTCVDGTAPECRRVSCRS